jgi:hypothetical protein
MGSVKHLQFPTEFGITSDLAIVVEFESRDAIWADRNATIYSAFFDNTAIVE